MTKEFIKRLLESQTITDIDLNTFISEYTINKLGTDITGEQVLGIATLIKTGYFDLRFALLEAAKSLDLNVLTITDRNGVILRTHVYESF